MQVADAPLNATPVNAIVTPSAGVSGTLATFSDTNPGGTQSDFWATVDWGDGTSPGVPVLAPDGSGWDVRGSHNYGVAGVYNLTVTIHDVGGASTTARPQIAVVPHMNVARITNNAPSGYLTPSEETSPGAFVPLDNNDWDYNGTTDMFDTGPVPGDQYLLPVTLPGLSGATAQDAYTLTCSSGIKIYLGSDRSSPYNGQPLPAGSDRTVYIAGAQAGGIKAPETLTENFSIGSTSKSNLDTANVVVFTLYGALDVPGGAGYDYTSDLTTGSWITPNGGTITGGSNTGGANGSDAVITWNNTPEVGYGLYQVNSDYTWGIGVNVVGITLTSSSYTYGGPPVQYVDTRFTPAVSTELISSSASGAAMTITASLTVTGPTVNGVERGTKYICIGFVQDGRFTALNGTYVDKTVRTSTLQDGVYHVDYLTPDPTTGTSGSTPPWYDSNGAGFWLGATATSSSVTISINDTPRLYGTDRYFDSAGSALASENIRFDLRDYMERGKQKVRTGAG